MRVPRISAIVLAAVVMGSTPVSSSSALTPALEHRGSVSCAPARTISLIGSQGRFDVAVISRPCND